MSVVVGIDVGASGAIAYIDADSHALLHLEDMPIHKVQIGSTLRSRVDRARLLSFLAHARCAPVFVERPDYRPMRQTNRATGQTESRQIGSAGAGAFGESYGCVLMGTTAAGMSLTEVRAGSWKRALSCGASKDDMVRRAQEIWPTWAKSFVGVRDGKMDGRAEACLIALYGARTLKGGLNSGA